MYTQNKKFLLLIAYLKDKIITFIKKDKIIDNKNILITKKILKFIKFKTD